MTEQSTEENEYKWEEILHEETGSFWETCLRAIYGEPSSVSVLIGEWKTGKTDLALHLIEECKRLELISQAGSNIMCFKDKGCTEPDPENVRYIDNFLELKSWMYTGFRKMFIFDEALKSAPSRRAMSRLNTGWLEILPELSKGRCHLVVIVQTKDYAEKSFLDPAYVRAEWEKPTLRPSNPQYRKIVDLRSRLIPWPYNHTFQDLPPTKIFFDPYRSAPWKEVPEGTQLGNLSIELQIAWDYGHGLSTDDIVKKYKNDCRDRTQATRMIRKALKALMDKLQVADTKRWNKSADPEQL